VQSNPCGKFFGKNTIDLQWKMRANYNARRCGSLRKAASARSIASNGKNNSQNNRKQSEIRRHALARPAAALASCLMDGVPVSSGGRRAHKSETRISTIADFGVRRQAEEKALPSSLLADA
jgi:hypothetical protein